MIKSEDNKPNKSAKSTKPDVVSKITIIQLDKTTHIKVLQMGDKAVVRQKGGILFNNLNNRQNFDKWWEDTIDAISKNTKFEVTKSEIVDNNDMVKILAKYK